MSAQPPHPIVQLARALSGRPNAGVRYLTAQQAHRMNVPNAMVDAVPFKGGLRPARFMFVPQSTWQALDSLTRDTGVNWPERTQAIALMTLLHEAGHLRGGKQWQNERRQQAFALRMLQYAFRRLGIEPDKRKALWGHIVDYQRELPRDYQTPGLLEQLLKTRPLP